MSLKLYRLMSAIPLHPSPSNSLGTPPVTTSSSCTLRNIGKHIELTAVSGGIAKLLADSCLISLHAYTTSHMHAAHTPIEHLPGTKSSSLAL
ncbi:hypothetical protein AYI68_g7761 [Smittium mucronatum]|uniref:Uncharacterized protein n=1 Tax=Smittium mucronatum TaxID=133383 RepID=A0A1R0GMU1_9FUNG|nr:hypothetical protein AYI68_g7761 [Smittium mucronatum]